MMKEKIREKVLSHLGQHMRFRYNGARNQKEEFFGYIENVYSNVFTIHIENDTSTVKTFSYSDVLLKTLEIFDK